MSERGPTDPLPSPRAHLAATLRLVDALAARAGGSSAWPGGELVREALARPFSLPASVRPDLNGMKYDAYVTEGPAGAAWGVAFNDRWEGRAIWATVDRLATDLPGEYDLDWLTALRRAVPSTSVTVSVGFDRAGEAPRLKLYLQEADWSEGVLSAGAFGELGEELRRGCVLPAVVPADQPLGVLTVVLRPDGSGGLKAYVGGETAVGAASALGGTSSEVDSLAAGMAAACPSGPAWHYLTIRMEAGEPPRYAMNRIWEHVRTGFGDAGALDEAWSEVGQLFARAGRQGAFEELRRLRQELGDLRIVPTAAAIEKSGTSADAYLAAWPA